VRYGDAGSILFPQSVPSSTLIFSSVFYILRVDSYTSFPPLSILFVNTEWNSPFSLRPVSRFAFPFFFSIRPFPVVAFQTPPSPDYFSFSHAPPLHFRSSILALNDHPFFSRRDQDFSNFLRTLFGRLPGRRRNAVKLRLWSFFFTCPLSATAFSPARPQSALPDQQIVSSLRRESA